MTLADTARGRLIQQFKGRENIEDLIDALWAPLLESQVCLESLRDARALDVATGVWLDLLGDIIGLARPQAEVPYGMIFAYKFDPEAEDDTSKSYDNGYYQSETGLLDDQYGELLDDESYRVLLRAKAAANNRDGTIRDLYEYLATGFGMTPTFVEPEHSRSWDSGFVDIETDVQLTQGQRYMIASDAPRLAGVRVSIVNWPTDEEE